MRVQPENLIELWRDTQKEILDQHPDLVDLRAGELAAARMLNWYHEDWAALTSEMKKAFLSGSLDINNPRFQLYSALLEWSPFHDLRQISGSQTLLRDVDHPIVTEQSTSATEIIGIRNYWKTGRIEGEPSSPPEIRAAWREINSEFRERTRGGGCLYTNHQGFHAIKTAFEDLHQTEIIDEAGGITVTFGLAQNAADYFRKQAGVWGGKIDKNFEDLANSFEEAIDDARKNGKKGISIVDTTIPGDEKDSAFNHVRKTLRHEAAHVWEYT